mgnify:CR=1 FL=1
MKQSIFYALAFMLTIGTISCSSDDDKGSDSGSIVGKWTYSQEGYILNGTEILEAYDHECSTKKDFLEFFNNGTATDNYYYSDCTSDIENFNYQINGNKVIMSYMGNGETVTEELNILTLNSSMFKVSFTDVFDGVEYTYISVLTRQ